MLPLEFRIEAMTKRKSKKNENAKSLSKQKSELVERIVAMMHEGEPQIVVRRDVRLPAKHGDKRSRQIDVLLEGHFAGYPTMLAVECKNYKRPIDVGDVGRFRDLLEDVGLSPQQGVLVSASKIGTGALDRARGLDMKVYELAGLTPDRLAAAVHEASQFMIVVVPTILGLSVEEEGSAGEDVGGELLILFDESEKAVAWIPDLAWLKWLEGEPASDLGEYEVELEIPRGWHLQVNGQRVRVLSASARVKVSAAVVAFPGSASNLAMIDPEDQSMKRFRATASFERSPGEYPVFTFDEESELEAFIKERPEAVKMTVGRIKAPRIWFGHVYWPPSARVMQRIRQHQRFYQAGRIRRLQMEDLRGVEGTDLRTLWEPIVHDYPLLEMLRNRDG